MLIDPFFVYLYSYEYPPDVAYVQYEPFCDEIESIFTLKHLEKAPQVKPVQFKPPVEVDLNILDKDSEIILQRTLARLAEQVNTLEGIIIVSED